VTRDTSFLDPYLDVITSCDRDSSKQLTALGYEYARAPVSKLPTVQIVPIVRLHVTLGSFLDLDAKNRSHFARTLADCQCDVFHFTHFVPGQKEVDDGESGNAGTAQTRHHNMSASDISAPHSTHT
jgi:hypothetical protein